MCESNISIPIIKGKSLVHADEHEHRQTHTHRIQCCPITTATGIKESKEEEKNDEEEEEEAADEVCRRSNKLGSVTNFSWKSNRKMITVCCSKTSTITCERLADSVFPHQKFTRKMFSVCFICTHKMRETKKKTELHIDNICIRNTNMAHYSVFVSIYAIALHLSGSQFVMLPVYVFVYWNWLRAVDQSDKAIVENKFTSIWLFHQISICFYN